MNVRDLKLRVRSLLSRRSVNRELDEELAFHLERETQKNIANGLNPAEARSRALARFGPVPLAADQCRDARRTGFIDDLWRDVLYALRAFLRAPMTALTIVATVGVGLALVAVVFTIFSVLFLRADAVRNPGELFEIRRLPSPTSSFGSWVAFTRPQYEALRRDTSHSTDAVAMLSGIATRIDGRATDGTLVTGNFFQMLGVQAALGRTLTPADDVRFAGRQVVVLSDRGRTKLFAGEPTAIGRSLLINGAPYEIVGIMPPEFRGLVNIPPDFWAPLALAGQFRPGYGGKEDDIPLEVVGRLKPGISKQAATSALTAWVAGNPDLAEVNRRPKTVMLRPRRGTLELDTDLDEALLTFSPLFFAFSLVLIVGCANVANLLLARGVSRQREIGIRLSLGASRWRIVRQLLTESLLLALVSAACALALSRLFLIAALNFVMATLPLEMTEQISVGVPAFDWRVVVFLLCGAIVSTVFFGLAPALQATRLALIQTMRGELTRDARPGGARNALITLQVGASALLLICAVVFLRSELAVATIKPGLRTSDTLMLSISKESLRPAIFQAVSGDPSVASVAASWPQVLASSLAKASTAATSQPVGYKFVSPEYFALLDIEVLKGRVFAETERSPDSGVAVISGSTARRLWPHQDAIGQVMHLEADGPPPGESSAPRLPFRAFTVVGIVRDVRFGVGPFPLADGGVYVPTDLASSGTSLTVRVHGNPDQTRPRLIQSLARIDPAVRITTLQMLASRATYLLQIAFGIAAVLGVLALALTLSGIFSVLSYVVEQRRQEIGVRMALGATARNIAGVVLSQSFRPVVFGLIAGGGLAAAVATALMFTSIASGLGEMVHVLDPVAYAASLFLIVCACAVAASIPALRASRIDPMKTLRQE